ALLNTCSMDADGVAATSPVEVRERWVMPYVDLQNNGTLVLSPEGKLVGYALLASVSDSYTRLRATGRVHPAYRKRGIGTYLMQFMELRAREMLPLAAPQNRVALTAGCSANDGDAREFILASGFSPLRTFWLMRIDFDSPPPQPHWPVGVSVRQMVGGQDEQAVWDADQDIFRDHWGYMPMPFEDFVTHINSLHYDPTLSFLALADGQIAGFSLNLPGTTEDPAMGFIEDLGVRRAWRRQGIALALLYHSFGAFYRAGKTSAALSVDSNSLTGATRLYERAGMHIMRQFDLYEKELRPGVEIAVRSL
ncbi:MAG TPA: GNAT family N-acetyltransferase, partial [Aggregatilineales bacterium]|nr:GNAT family N-acetyltransferase [Aggregatilineales bacterium]